MTTRPGDGVLGHLRLHRQKRVASLVRVTRRDGEQLHFTDHDRAIDFEGETYTPTRLGALSAGRVEAGLRSGNQELYGTIDGSVITHQDIESNLWRGAEIRHVVVDWSMPWLVIGRHRRWIRQVQWTGDQWVGVIEARSQVLQRPCGGRFGGAWDARCPYRLGAGATCRADISAAVKVGVLVETVVDSRTECQFAAASWSGSFADDYYRDGEIEWTSGDNVGTVSPIVGYTHATRSCTLLLPTPRPIQVGDEGTARPGCDGLFSTCRTKFSNGDNFGGDPHAPSAHEVIERPEDQ